MLFCHVVCRYVDRGKFIRAVKSFVRKLRPKRIHQIRSWHPLMSETLDNDWTMSPWYRTLCAKQAENGGKKTLKSGLPDSFWSKHMYQIGKTASNDYKLYQTGVCKLYLTAVKYFKWSYNIPIVSILRHSKIYPN
jgi:hypothetical protein